MMKEANAGYKWMEWIAHEWADDLGDPRQDIYNLEDGEPTLVGGLPTAEP
jgi:hypothetical protein